MRIAEALSLEDVVSREDYLDLLSHACDIFEAETNIQNSRDIQEAAALLRHRGETKEQKRWQQSGSSKSEQELAHETRPRTV